MSDGLLRRDALKIRATAERAAGGRKDDPRPRPRLFSRAREALEDRIVLAVNGQKLAARIPDGLHQKTAPADDALLVGKKKALARASGRKGGRNARSADHGLHDDIRVGIVREAGDGLGAAEHLDVTEADRAEGLFKLHHLRGIRNDRALRTCREADVHQRLHAGAARHGVNAEALGIARDDVKRRTADAARCAENRDGLCHVAPCQLFVRLFLSVGLRSLPSGFHCSAQYFTRGRTPGP